MEAIETVLIAIVALEMLDIFWPMKPIMRAPAAGIAFRLGATAAMVLGCRRALQNRPRFQREK